MSERERITVANRHAIDYDTLDKIAESCGGWMRSSNADGETAEVWHEDKTYVFSGEGLIQFLYAVKAKHVNHLYEAVDFCEYVAKSEKTPPSMFVRDAIVARAVALRATIEGGKS